MNPIESSDELVTRYHRQALRKLLVLVVSVVGVIVVVGLFSVSVYDSVSIMEAYGIIWDHIMGVQHAPRSTEWWADRFIWNTVMPRVVAAIVAGASLAAAGALMQSLMNNPLADPYSTGISSGACFGAIMALVLGLTINSLSGQSGMVVNAFLGSLIPVAIVILISKRMPVSPASLILVGTALSYFFSSMVTYMMVITDADTLQNAYIWQVGTLDTVTWESIPLMFGVTVVGSAFVMFLSRQLNILSLGDANAKTLGLDVEKFRIVCLLVMAVMTASIVCFTGTIGFLGLVAPHLVRLLIGSDNRFVIPIAMAMGAFILVLADYIAMSVSDVPVGVVMSIIGSPIFFALILWQKKGYGTVY
ncbi:MAG: iron ABC transporter permease [Candidatus Methanomethylophilaceae archaeon]|nr:iron ABC transporter permease [Candidatus Methanomethylophilaceae archaeon]